jgi:hypothetical protein
MLMHYTARLEAKKSSEPAGFEIHGRAFSPDLEESFDVYKQFDIEFENEQSTHIFLALFHSLTPTMCLDDAFSLVHFGIFC